MHHHPSIHGSSGVGSYPPWGEPPEPNSEAKNHKKSSLSRPMLHNHRGPGTFRNRLTPRDRVGKGRKLTWGTFLQEPKQRPSDQTPRLTLSSEQVAQAPPAPRRETEGPSLGARSVDNSLVRFPLHRVSKETMRVVVFHWRPRGPRRNEAVSRDLPLMLHLSCLFTESD
ncbi:hypothetical protein MTO96_037268 [Rhipicephalus appendiculatus]